MTENLIGEAHRPGRIEVVCGSMFSGKTEELIRRMKRAKFAKQKVEIFKPALDTRYSEEDVVSHYSLFNTSCPHSNILSMFGVQIFNTSAIDLIINNPNGKSSVKYRLLKSGRNPFSVFSIGAGICLKAMMERILRVSDLAS